METDNVIVRRINQIIAEKGLKKSKVASCIGVPATTLNSWLNRTKDFPVSYVSSIAEALGVSVNWLLSDSESADSANYSGDLTDEESFLLAAYRSLDQEGRIVVASKAIEETRRKNARD